MDNKIKSFTPPISRKIAEEQAKAILKKMQLEDKLKLIGGIHGFNIQANEKFGIKEVIMSDASHGVNIRDNWLEEKLDVTLEKSTSFPCLLQLASTWNDSLAGEYGESVGEECRAGGVGILLGPGMNIYRHSQCGRNFEYLGEDPYLVSSMIKNYVEALQNTGVAATLKHFLVNNTDYFRRKSNSVVGKRALHEIYLPAFKAGIEAGAMCLMTSYNLINGEWCSQNKELITDLLRDKLGFDGLVMTDWWAIDDNKKAVKSGLDLEMPAYDVLSKTKELLENKEIEESYIDRMVLSILKTSIAMDFYNKDFKKPELQDRIENHEQTALKIAEEGTILLKNRDKLLPISHNKEILVTGKFIEEFAKGGGAAEVEGYNRKNLLEALNDAFPGQINYIKNPTKEKLESAHMILLSVGTSDSEGWDRPFELPVDEENEIIKIVNSNENTVVIVNSGSGIRMTDWKDKAGAIIYGWYSGQTGNTAMANIL